MAPMRQASKETWRNAVLRKSNNPLEARPSIRYYFRVASPSAITFELQDKLQADCRREECSIVLFHVCYRL